MKYAIVLGFAALAVALPQSNYNPNSYNPNTYNPNTYNPNTYNPNTYNPTGNSGYNYYNGQSPRNYGPGGIAGDFAYEIGKDFQKGSKEISVGIAKSGKEIAKGIEHGSKGIGKGIEIGGKGLGNSIEKGFECAFGERHRCKIVAGEEVPVAEEDVKAESDIQRRQFLANLFGGNRSPNAEEEQQESEESESEIETTGNPIPVMEFTPGQVVAPKSE